MILSRAFERLDPAFRCLFGLNSKYAEVVLNDVCLHVKLSSGLYHKVS